MAHFQPGWCSQPLRRSTPPGEKHKTYKQCEHKHNKTSKMWPHNNTYNRTKGLRRLELRHALRAVRGAADTERARRHQTCRARLRETLLASPPGSSGAEVACAHIHMHIHIHIHIHTHTHIHIHTYTYAYTYIYTHIHACLHTSIHPDIHTCMHTIILQYTHTVVPKSHVWCRLGRARAWGLRSVREAAPGTSRREKGVSEAPQGNEGGAITPLHIRTLVFLCSAWF